MPNSSTTDDQVHHPHGPDGTHVMPDSTVMKGPSHDHSAHAHHDHDTHAPAAASPAASGDQSQVDGELTEGKANVDESMVTGEPIPVAKTVGSKEINYRYEEDVEKFFRHSPAVVRDVPPS